MPERLIISEVDDQRTLHEHFARYQFAESLVGGKTVIDVACGTGYGSSHLLAKGARRVTGIDVSSDAVAYAKSHYGAEHLDFLCRDAQDLSSLQPVDVVVSFETIEHLEDPERFLQQVIRVLKSDGTFIVSTPIRKKGKLTDRPENPYHLREWSVEEFTRLLTDYFHRVEARYQYDVRESWYPLSKTIRRFLMRVRDPHLAAEFEECRVLDNPPSACGVAIRKALVVAVCSSPIAQ